MLVTPYGKQLRLEELFHSSIEPTIGRSAKSTLSLVPSYFETGAQNITDTQVLLLSRCHAQFSVVGGQLLVKDLNTSNGTYVNNHKLISERPHALHDDDIISLGGPNTLKQKGKHEQNPWTFHVKDLHFFLANHPGVDLQRCSAYNSHVDQKIHRGENSTPLKNRSLASNSGPGEYYSFSKEPQRISDGRNGRTMELLSNTSETGSLEMRSLSLPERATLPLSSNQESKNKEDEIVIDLTAVDDSPKCRNVRKRTRSMTGHLIHRDVLVPLKNDVHQEIVIEAEKANFENPSFPPEISVKNDEPSREATSVANIFRENYTCAICQELMVGAYSFVPCGHLYCGICIANWLDRSKQCPNCRKQLTAVCTRQVTVDNIIEGSLAFLTEEEKKIRVEKQNEWNRNKKSIESRLTSISKTPRIPNIVDRYETDDDYDDYIDEDYVQNNEMGFEHFGAIGGFPSVYRTALAVLAPAFGQNPIGRGTTAGRNTQRSTGINNLGRINAVSRDSNSYNANRNSDTVD